MKGYFTVEATLLMPIVFYVYIFIIYMVFFQYNRCITEQDIYICALRGSRIWEENNQDIYIKTVQETAKLDGEKLIAMNSPQYSVFVGKGKVTVTAEGELDFPFAGFMNLVMSKMWLVSSQRECSSISPVRFIKNCRLLENR